MLVQMSKWILGSALLGELFWCRPYDCVLLLLVGWTVAVAVLLYLNLASRVLWIPVLLAITGVFGSLVILAIPGNVTLAVNVATLAGFAVSVELLERWRSSPYLAARPCPS